jgi:hypothetical protein
MANPPPQTPPSNRSSLQGLTLEKATSLSAPESITTHVRHRPASGCGVVVKGLNVGPYIVSGDLGSEGDQPANGGERRQRTGKHMKMKMLMASQPTAPFAKS